MMRLLLFIILSLLELTSLGYAFYVFGDQNWVSPDDKAEDSKLYSVKDGRPMGRLFEAALNDISGQDFSPGGNDGKGTARVTPKKQSERLFSSSPILTALIMDSRQLSSLKPKRYAKYRLKHVDDVTSQGEMGANQSSDEIEISDEMGAKIDDVISSLSNSQKRSRGRLDSAMPPTNELCMMMNIRCY